MKNVTKNDKKRSSHTSIISKELNLGSVSILRFCIEPLKSIIFVKPCRLNTFCMDQDYH